jgi:molecular chaperone GrpE
MSQNRPPHEQEQPSQGDASTADDQALEQALQAALDQESGGEAQAFDGSESLESRLAESQREVLRARAEMENFRKRMQRDSDQQLKYANVPLVRDLIEVIDNLNRALDAAGQDPSGAPQEANASSSTALRDGVKMVVDQLAGVMNKYGCKRIESVGHEFDPNVHEAIAQMPSQEHAAGLVMQEVAAGYRLHDRVVRPSSVIVSTGP